MGAILTGIVLVLLLVGVLIGVGAVKQAAQRERQNVLRLAREYGDAGDFDRALNLLDTLLIKNADDTDALELQREILEKKLEALKQALARGTGNSDELARTLAQLEKTIKNAQTAGSQNSSQAKTGSGTESSAQSAGQTAPGVPQSQADADAARKAEEEARVKAEALAKAQAEAARQEELAKKSKELREKIDAITALIKKGKEELRSKNLTNAQSNFSQATNMLPEGEKRFNALMWTDIGEAWYEAYRADPQSPNGLEAAKEAQRAAQEAIRTDETLAEPHYTLSKIYNDANLPDRALSELEQAQRLDPNNYLYAYELGKTYFKLKRYEEARRAFESVTIKLNPKFEPAFFNLGMTYKALKNNAAALKAFQSAVALKPDYVKAHIEIGRLLMASNDYTGAVKSLQTALSFDGNDVSALRELGIAYAAMNKLKEAEQSFLQVLKIAPDALSYYNLAKTQYELNKPQDALVSIQKAVELSPGTALYYYQQGLIAVRNKNTDLAIASYAKAAELNKSYTEPRINLGIIYLESGFIDKALALLEEAYKINPKSLEANNNLGNAYGKKGLFEKSVFYYENALALAPRDATIRLNLARAYVQSGNNEKARDTYVELIKLNPNAWDAMYELGKLYITMDDKDNAKKILTELLAKKPDYPNRADIETILASLK